MKKSLLSLLLLLLATFCMAFAGCNFSNTTLPTLTLSKTSVELTVGETAELTADCSDETLTVTWASNAENVATVDNGLVTAVGEGTAVIEAKAGDATATCEVTVNKNDAPVFTIVKLNGSTEETSVSLLVGLTAEIEVALEREGADLGVDFEMVSSNPEVATVADGVITAIKKGTATISYSATFEGLTYDGSVEVTVNDDVLVQLSASSLELCTMEGDATYANSGSLTATLYLNGEEADASTITWISDNEGIATVSGGIVTGVKKGMAKISAVYTADGKEYYAYANVTVYAKKIQLDGQLLFSLVDSAEELAVDLTYEGTATDVQLNGQAVEFAEEDGLSIPVSAVEKSGYYTLSVFTDVCEYAISAIIADKVIMTAEEFANWPSYIRPDNWGLNKVNNYDKFVVLGADIDFGGATYTNELGNWATITYNGGKPRVAEVGKTVALGDAAATNAIVSGYDSRFYGVFDGLGHTVSNIEFDVQRSGIMGDFMHGTLKNLAVTGVVMGKTNFGGAIAGRFHGTAENVFVEGSISKNVNYTNGLFSGAFSSTTKLINVVCVLSHGKELVEAGNKIAIIGVGDGIVAENLINVVGLGYGQTAISTFTDMTPMVYGYESVSAYLADEPNLSFATGYWTIENGFPVFASAVDQIKDIELVLTADGKEVTAIELGGSVQVDGKTFAMYATLPTRSNQQAYYTFTARAEGVAEELQPVVNGNVISIPLTFPAGTEIIITATSQLTGKSVEYKTISGQPKDLSVNGSVVNEYFSYADTKQTLTNAEFLGTVASVKTSGGAEIAFAAVDNGFEVTTEALLAAGYTADTFNKGTNEYLTIVTDKGLYKVMVKFASFAIRTADDLRIWPSKIRPATWTPSGSNAYSGYVVLANNIDFAGGRYWQNELVAGSQLGNASTSKLYFDSSLNAKVTGITAAYDARFYGTFDGQGYTITNVNFNAQHGGLFGSYFQGVVKDLGITNSFVQNNWSGMLAYRNYTSGVIENIYVQGYCWKTLTREFGLLFGLDIGAKTQYKNVVVIYDAANENALQTSATYGLTGQTQVAVQENRYTNCIAIAPIAFAITNSNATVALASYADVDTFKAANVSLSAFSATYWDTSLVYPVFKSAKVS